MKYGRMKKNEQLNRMKVRDGGRGIKGRGVRDEWVRVDG